MEEHRSLLIAYALILVGSATAGVYGLMSAPPPDAYYAAIAYAFGMGIACHCAAWLHGVDNRAAWMRTLFALCAGAIAAAGIVWVSTGEQEAQRIRLAHKQREEAVRKADIDLGKLEAQIADIKPFRPTTRKAVAALETALATLSLRRVTACGAQGPQCQQVTAEEQAKAQELATARTDMAATDVAARLHAAVAGIKAELAKPAPPAPSALTQQTGISITESAAFFVLLLSVALALGGVSSVALVVTGRRETQAAAAVQTRRPWFAALDDATPMATPSLTPLASEEMDYAATLAKLEATLFPEGDVSAFVVECVRPSRGRTTRMHDIFLRYRLWCTQQSPPRLPVEPRAFGSAFIALSETHGASIRCVGERFYADNLELRVPG